MGGADFQGHWKALNSVRSDEIIFSTNFPTFDEINYLTIFPVANPGIAQYMIVQIVRAQLFDTQLLR